MYQGPFGINRLFLERATTGRYLRHVTSGVPSRAAAGQVGNRRILTPIESAMRVRSPGSLVTTGAWWRTAVTMTIASTTSAVPEAAQATPAARPVRWSSGGVSQALDGKRTRL